MKETISGETIFEHFIEQIEWNPEAVLVQNPYTPAYIISMAYANIEKYGLYQDYCREWHQKPRLDETWSNIKSHFARVFNETRRSSINLKTEGYAANVQYAQANASLFAEMHQDHTMDLANLAMATQANRILVALLTKNIAELSTQVSTLTTKLAADQPYNACLKRYGHL